MRCELQGFPKKEETQVFKATKFACRSLKGKGARSGVRVIYTFHEQEDLIVLIEIYYKGDRPNEDRERITRYLESL